MSEVSGAAVVSDQPTLTAAESGWQKEFRERLGRVRDRIGCRTPLAADCSPEVGMADFVSWYAAYGFPEDLTYDEAVELQAEVSGMEEHMASAPTTLDPAVTDAFNETLAEIQAVLQGVCGRSVRQ